MGPRDSPSWAVAEVQVVDIGVILRMLRDVIGGRKKPRSRWEYYTPAEKKAYTAGYDVGYLRAVRRFKKDESE